MYGTKDFLMGGLRRTKEWIPFREKDLCDEFDAGYLSESTRFLL
jgi:hypothetical protein